MSSSGSLTNSQNNFCEYGGTFGVLLSLTCLIQHLAVAIPNKVTNPMIPGYNLAIAAFLFLGLKKKYSIILILISAANSLFTEWQWIKHFSFSLVVVLLLIYHVVIIVVFYAEQMPAAFKKKILAEKAEKDLWKGKI